MTKKQFKLSISFIGLMGRQRKMQHNMIGLGYVDVESLDLESIKMQALARIKKEVKAVQNRIILILDYVETSDGIMTWQPFSKDHIRVDLTKDYINLIESKKEDLMDLERKESNHTYEVTIVIGNLQPHQLDALSKLVDALEDNGGNVSCFDTQND
jgi:hypothetical protein